MYLLIIFSFTIILYLFIVYSHFIIISHYRMNFPVKSETAANQDRNYQNV